MGVTSGHNTTYYVELGTPAVQGVFHEIPGLRGDLMLFSGKRNESDATAHRKLVDRYVTGPIKREPWVFTLNFDPTNSTHLGMRAAFAALDASDRVRGWRGVGPEGSAGVDEIIQSGEITGWVDKSPEDAGIREVEVTVRMTEDAFKLDGVIYS